MKQFKDNLNTSVITTKYVLENNSPIVIVNHYYDDGVWEFVGSEDILNDEDYRVISLEEIINLDDSVLELADLPLGGTAYRKDNNSPWMFSQQK